MGFCNRWIWECTEQFLIDGGYLIDSRSPTQYMRDVSDIVEKLGWSVSKRAKLCRLYIIAKAKSLWAGKGWLWRPIAASPQPIVQRSRLRIATGAFTCFLNNLVREIPMSFLRLSITKMSAWFHWCAENGFTAIAELDCKEQFNNIQPRTIEQHFKTGSEWLIARKRWRAKELTWSVHHTMHTQK